MEPYQELEAKFGQYVASPNVVACSSGTSALHLALESLQLPKGGEVIVPDFTMVACARAVALAGLMPVLVDCGPDLLIDPALARMAITDKTVAIMPVHIYGRVCQLGELYNLAERHGLAVVEDRAEAHGVDFNGWVPDAACWSFYKNKVIGGEEGGAIAFANPALPPLARQLRNLGFTNAHDYFHLPRGHNYRLANALAQLILISLDEVEDNLAKRRALENWYDKSCPPAWRMGSRAAPWVYDLRIPSMTHTAQDRVVAALHAEGISARHAFKPMHLQPEFRLCRLVVDGPGIISYSQLVSQEVIYLPLTPDLPHNVAAHAFDVITRTLGRS